MAGMSRPNYSENIPSARDLTSCSMVDLPVGDYNGSMEHLDRVEEGNLPHSSVKSQSVPRLTLMSVSTLDGEKGEGGGEGGRRGREGRGGRCQ